MDNGKKTTCASCRKYPLSEAAKNSGRAMCPDYGIERAWNDPATVLYMPAKDREARKQIVIQLMQENNKGK